MISPSGNIGIYWKFEDSDDLEILYATPSTDWSKVEHVYQGPLRTIREVGIFLDVNGGNGYLGDFSISTPIKPLQLIQNIKLTFPRNNQKCTILDWATTTRYDSSIQYFLLLLDEKFLGISLLCSFSVAKVIVPNQHLKIIPIDIIGQTWLPFSVYIKF